MQVQCKFSASSVQVQCKFGASSVQVRCKFSVHIGEECRVVPNGKRILWTSILARVQFKDIMPTLALQYRSRPTAKENQFPSFFVFLSTPTYSRTFPLVKFRRPDLTPTTQVVFSQVPSRHLSKCTRCNNIVNLELWSTLAALCNHWGSYPYPSA